MLGICGLLTGVALALSYNEIRYRLRVREARIRAMRGDR